MGRINPQTLKKYVEGTASEEECQEVEQWLDNDENLFEDSLKRENLAKYDGIANLSTLWKSFVRKTDEGIRYIRYWWWGTRVALPLLLVVGAIGIYVNNGYSEDPHNSQELLTLEVAKGQRASVRLPDSTRVYVGGGSKLVYPKRFKGSERRISLEYGQAFLEVTKDSAHPFIVQSDRIQVKVLGTAFNISNRIGDKRISVLLQEGSVEFSDQRGLTQVMKPGDQLIYDKLNPGLQLFTDMDVSSTALWATGKLQFRHVHLKDVVDHLEDRYNVVFTIQDESLYTIPVTGKFDDMPLERILFLLGESTGLTITQDDNNILVRKY